MPSDKDFRRIALGLDGVVEQAHMGHPDFRANGRIFATIQIDPGFGMVKLTPAQQKRFMQEAPQSFRPEAGAWGAGGCTKVQLAAVDEELLGEALTLAWQNSAGKAATKKKAGRAGKAKRKKR